MNQGLTLRNSLLMATGVVVGLLILALAPALLRQTSFDNHRLASEKIRLIAVEDELLETEETEEEPEPPPELDEPEPPEMEIPETEMPEIETPQTSYAFTLAGYDNTVQLPSLSSLGLKGVKVAPQNFTRKLAKGPLPGLPKHGPPRTRFNPDEVDKMPQAVATTQPIYPHRAKRLGIEGAVRVRFLVKTSGRTDLFSILTSEPPGVFDRTVRKTVKNWKFKPAIKDGRAVETWVETIIKFKII